MADDEFLESLIVEDLASHSVFHTLEFSHEHIEKPTGLSRSGLGQLFDPGESIKKFERAGRLLGKTLK